MGKVASYFALSLCFVCGHLFSKSQASFFDPDERFSYRSLSTSLALEETTEILRKIIGIPKKPLVVNVNLNVAVLKPPTQIEVLTKDMEGVVIPQEVNVPIVGASPPADPPKIEL